MSETHFSSWDKIFVDQCNGQRGGLD